MTQDKAGWVWPLDAMWCDDQIEVTCSGGVVNVAVTSEQAVDSYNHSFTCDIVLPVDQVRELRDFLTKALDAHLNAPG